MVPRRLHLSDTDSATGGGATAALMLATFECPASTNGVELGREASAGGVRAIRAWLLCQADRDRNAVGVAQEVVDAAHEVAFEAADRFSGALPVAALFG